MIMSPSEIPLVFDYKVLAKILGVSESTACVLSKSEGFPAHQITPRKRRIFRHEFLAWMGAREPEATTSTTTSTTA